MTSHETPWRNAAQVCKTPISLESVPLTASVQKHTKPNEEKRNMNLI